MDCTDTMMIKKFYVAIILIFFLGFIALMHGNTILIFFESDEPSQSIGTPASGSLVNGKRLPTRGNNFISYSYLGALLGRNSAHHKVRDTVLQTYVQLEEKLPDKTFVYGETGWPNGGRFRPHKTHQNGLSVDFMVPVTKDGRSVPLPASVFNKWGYGIEFDRQGRYKNFRIDYETMAVHIGVLAQTAQANGLRLRRVIFAPDLQTQLFNTATGKLIHGRVSFSKNPSWVRHDDHYHVDFEIR
jgi:penicillin-insensitive murein DD-endopeptidase